MASDVVTATVQQCSGMGLFLHLSLPPSSSKLWPPSFHGSPWHPRAVSLFLPLPGLPLHLSCPGCWGWKGHLCPVDGWREWWGLSCCHWSWQQMLPDGGCTANSGFCGLRQNPNYFQLGDCSDSCSEQGLLSQLRTCSTFSWGWIPVFPARGALLQHLFLPPLVKPFLSPTQHHFS